MANGTLVMKLMSDALGANEIGCGLPNMRPAARNPTISKSLSAVHKFWNALPYCMPRRWTSEMIQTTARPGNSGGTPGMIDLK